MPSYTKNQYQNLNKLFLTRLKEKNMLGENNFLSSRKWFENPSVKKLSPMIMSEILKYPKCKEIIKSNTIKIFDIAPKGILIQVELNNGKIHTTSARFSVWAANTEESKLAILFDLMTSFYYEAFNEDYLNYLV